LKQRILKLDLIGASIIIPTVVMLLLALQWGGSTYPWKSAKIIGLFCGAGAMLCVFVFSQIKLGENATLPPRLFKDRNVLCAFAFSFFFGAGFFVLIFYLAIYFQSVKGSSATHAGIQLLPLLVACVLSSIVTGGLVTAIGYYVPIQIFCMILFSIGSGLLTTFDLHTSTGKWFGYQVLAGLGIGVGFQSGVVIVQTVLPLSDVPVATAMVSFFQTLGGALFIAVAQSLFQHGLTENIQREAPELDAQIFLHSGATQIRSLLARLHAEHRLEVVLQGYVNGLTHTFWITTACAIVALFVCAGLEWKSVKDGDGQGSGKKEKAKDEEDVKQEPVAA
jgi:MFS family permease